MMDQTVARKIVVAIIGETIIASKGEYPVRCDISKIPIQSFVDQMVVESID